MHRSGTSAITRGLKELGVDLGKNLMPAIPFSNPKGFWEDMDIYNLSERLLERLELRWDSVAPIDTSAWERPETTPFRLDAIDLLNTKIASSPVWGFKDPRTIRLLPFWKSVFLALKIAPRYVIALRNPLSVARSLQARDAIPLEKSSLLWLQHTIPVVSGTAGSRRLVVDYDRLMDDPVRELQRMATALGLEASNGENLASSEYIRGFLSSELRHTRYNLEALGASPVLAGLARQTYGLLLQSAEDRLALDDLQCTNEWLEIERTIHELGVFSVYLEARESQLQRAVSENNAQAEALAQRENEVRQKHAQLAALEQTVTRCKNELRARDARITDLDRAVADRDTQIAELKRTVADRDAALSAVRTSASWRWKAPLRFLRRSWQNRGPRIEEWAHALYLAAPIPMALKMRLKGLIFAVFAPIFRRTTGYQAWVAFEATRHKVPSTISVKQRWLRIRRLVREWVRAVYKAPSLLIKALKLMLKEKHIQIESAFWVGDRGILVGGWLAECEDKLVSLTVSPAAKRAVNIPIDSLAFYPRPDVHEFFKGCGTKLRSADTGFWFWSPLVTDIGQQLPSITAQFQTGSRQVLTVPFEQPGTQRLELVQRILQSFDPDRPAFEEILAKIGPAIQALWESRSCMPVTAESVDYGIQVEQPAVSILVPLYGRIDFVKYQLSQFADDSDILANELIYVLDDPERRDELFLLCDEIAPMFEVPFKVICSGRNLGYAGANNLGARHARGQLLLLLNSDVMPKYPGWLSSLAKVYKDLPDAGALGPKLLYEDESIQHAGIAPMKLPGYRTLWFNDHPGKGLPNFPEGLAPPKKVAAVTGACLMVDRSVYLQQGGLDEAYILGDFEDSDFCHKLSTAGMSNYYLPTVELYHLERQSQDLIGNPRWRQSVTFYNAWLHTQRWDSLLHDLSSRPTP